jgi:hypothetical protein
MPFKKQKSSIAESSYNLIKDLHGSFTYKGKKNQVYQFWKQNYMKHWVHDGFDYYEFLREKRGSDIYSYGFYAKYDSQGKAEKKAKLAKSYKLTPFVAKNYGKSDVEKFYDQNYLLEEGFSEDDFKGKVCEFGKYSSEKKDKILQDGKYITGKNKKIDYFNKLSPKKTAGYNTGLLLGDKKNNGKKNKVYYGEDGCFYRAVKKDVSRRLSSIFNPANGYEKHDPWNPFSAVHKYVPLNKKEMISLKLIEDEVFYSEPVANPVVVDEKKIEIPPAIPRPVSSPVTFTAKNIANPAIYSNINIIRSEHPQDIDGKRCYKFECRFSDIQEEGIYADIGIAENDCLVLYRSEDNSEMNASELAALLRDVNNYSKIKGFESSFLLNAEGNVKNHDFKLANEIRRVIERQNSKSIGQVV